MACQLQRFSFTPRLLELGLLCLLALVTFIQDGSEAFAAGVEIQSVSVSPIIGTLSRPNDGVVMRGLETQEGEKASYPRPEPRPESRPEVASDIEAYRLNVDIKVSVNSRLEDLLEQGVPLYFLTEVEAYRPRWYWKDELVHKASQSVRLSYQAITKQFRVTRNGLAVNYRTLGEALRSISSQRGWRFADAKTLVPKTDYDIYVRFRLDTSQLPRPFQLTMFTDSDWVPSSEWKRFSFTPEMTKTAQ